MPGKERAARERCYLFGLRVCVQRPGHDNNDIMTYSGHLIIMQLPMLILITYFKSHYPAHINGATTIML